MYAVGEENLQAAGMSKNVRQSSF